MTGEWYVPETWSTTGAVYTGPPVTAAAANYLCPDLLDHRRIGAADSARGRVVRLFFLAMRLWPVKR